MTLPTAAEIAELRKLAEAATPGEWRVALLGGLMEGRAIVTRDDVPRAAITSQINSLSPEDAALIVAMRNRLDSLLAAAQRARELEAENEKMRRERDASLRRGDQHMMTADRLRREIADAEPAHDLVAACERLVSYIDERKKWGPLMLARREREGTPPLDVVRTWPEHIGWQNAIANEGIAHEDIRTALDARRFLASAGGEREEGKADV